jgi:hypothetical protein
MRGFSASSAVTLLRVAVFIDKIKGEHWMQVFIYCMELFCHVQGSFPIYVLKNLEWPKSARPHDVAEWMSD